MELNVKSLQKAGEAALRFESPQAEFNPTQFLSSLLFIICLPL